MGTGGSPFYEVISQKNRFFTNEGFPKCTLNHRNLGKNTEIQAKAQKSGRSPGNFPQMPGYLTKQRIFV